MKNLITLLSLKIERLGCSYAMKKDIPELDRLFETLTADGASSASVDEPHEPWVTFKCKKTGVAYVFAAISGTLRELGIDCELRIDGKRPRLSEKNHIKLRQICKQLLKDTDTKHIKELAEIIGKHP